MTVLRLRVRNAAPVRAVARVRGGGHGVAGMRERAAALGGTLTAGPVTGGGFEICAALPLGAASEVGRPAAVSRAQ
ncbi:hypothetical protein [Paractinoplanes hotanensis]|uniref:histidine kinase n=1 Tax=Paractinoplanes hotanensis TaxID=2906497 RepID=A0ABT0XTM0_9ACTN|nr:hypothetical protein [Actinoplanes hotanensis]MCM4076489.1 hypothetical protein [Actinoplanes hotanensis]